MLLNAWTATARGDGGTLRVSQQRGSLQITVFTSPTPLRAGPVDVSVLVQDANSGEARLPTDRIEVQAWRQVEPEMILHCQATSAAATNKLFQDAQFELPAAGKWEIQVTVDAPQGREDVRFEAEVADRLPRWASMWPWFTWPVLAILLFAIRERRAWRDELDE